MKILNYPDRVWIEHFEMEMGGSDHSC